MYSLYMHMYILMYSLRSFEYTCTRNDTCDTIYIITVCDNN